MRTIMRGLVIVWALALMCLAGCSSSGGQAGAGGGGKESKQKPAAPEKGSEKAAQPAAASTEKKADWPRDGSQEKPLQVMLIPADGGTEEGTLKDFQPIFNAVTKTSGLHFNIKVGQSYGAVVEAQANGQVDVGFFGAVSYLQCKERGGAELLAVSVEKGSSVYYSGIFVPKASPVQSIADLKGKSMAFGDPNSTSSFNYPMAMLLDGGVDPVKDLGKIVMAGSHVNSLKACAEGKVEACAASFDSLEKAINQNQIPADALRPLKKSEPIPNPPLAMHPKLPAAIKEKLKNAFRDVHKAEGVTPDMIRGYGGKKCDRYDVDYPESEFLKAVEKLDKVDKIKSEVLAKAAQK